MRKNWLVLFFTFCGAVTVSAQTLVTYGKYTVDVKEFLRAYNKNNTQPVTNKKNAINEYLRLYINSRLKIREAYENGYDTLPQIKNEVNNLRAQIVENYMSDPGIADRLNKEAFRRSQKDIHVAHIFISFRNGNKVIDSAAAQHKLNDVLQKLRQGDDFMAVARQYSDDPSAATNKGDLGFITVFTLPYEFENTIYNTPAGKYSSPQLSKIGYHIFKVLSERKAVGKIKAQQILLAIPPGADETIKKKIAFRADSLYQQIMTGADFGKLAAAFSNDYVSSANNGNMPDIGPGQYDPAFETALWSLAKDGAVSKPFTTSHGWHIVKRISIKPVITDSTDKINLQDLQQKVSADGRWKVSRDFIYDRVAKKAGIKKFAYPDAELWALSDSLLDRKPLAIKSSIRSSSPLFRIGDTTSSAIDFISYAQSNRYKADGSGIKPYGQLMEEFVHERMYNYYRDNLEDFNDEFRIQMSEFQDGNLFFEIMQQEVWNKAQADSMILQQLYEKNKKNYTWNHSADAVIFFCSDKATATDMYNRLKKDPASWQKISGSYNDKVLADSARYEWSQIPNLNKVVPRPGLFTAPLINTNDNTASFAYIIKVYAQPMQRSFTEAKGTVINDYQSMLEEQWVQKLRVKYPVMIDPKVLESILK